MLKNYQNIGKTQNYSENKFNLIWLHARFVCKNVRIMPQSFLNVVFCANSAQIWNDNAVSTAFLQIKNAWNNINLTCSHVVGICCHYFDNFWAYIRSNLIKIVNKKHKNTWKTGKIIYFFKNGHKIQDKHFESSNKYLKCKKKNRLCKFNIVLIILICIVTNQKIILMKMLQKLLKKT